MYVACAMNTNYKFRNRNEIKCLGPTQNVRMPWAFTVLTYRHTVYSVVYFIPICNNHVSSCVTCDKGIFDKLSFTFLVDHIAMNA